MIAMCLEFIRKNELATTKYSIITWNEKKIFVPLFIYVHYEYKMSWYKTTDNFWKSSHIIRPNIIIPSTFQIT